AVASVPGPGRMGVKAAGRPGAPLPIYVAMVMITTGPRTRFHSRTTVSWRFSASDACHRANRLPSRSISRTASATTKYMTKNPSHDRTDIALPASSTLGTATGAGGPQAVASHQRRAPVGSKYQPRAGALTGDAPRRAVVH